MLLNPLDARAPRWSPFFEARSPRDFDMMAAALIPQQKDTVDPFWVTAARQLFSNGAGVLWRKGETTNRALVEHLLKTDLSDLAKAMEDTVAQSIVDPQNPKTALSVRAMLTANIGAMEVLADSGTPFSIREWVSGGVRQRVPVPDVPRRPAREPAGADLHVARDRGQLDAVPGTGRRQKNLGDPGRAAHAAPRAQPSVGARREPPVRRLLRAGRAGGLRPAGSLRQERRGDDFRALRHAGRVRRTRTATPRSGRRRTWGEARWRNCPRG